MNWQPDANSINEELKTVKAKKISGNLARYQFTNSYELAAGNSQPDANSISEDLRQFKVNRKPAKAARCQFAHSIRLGSWGGVVVFDGTALEKTGPKDGTKFCGPGKMLQT